MLASIAEGWLLEYAHRRAGRAFRRTIGAVLVTTLGIALYVDPEHGKTLFGLGTKFSAAVRAAGSGEDGVLFGALAISMALAVFLFLAGVALAQASLALPAVPVSPPRKTRIWTLSDRPGFALAQCLILQIMRTSEIRRPILTVLALGLPVVLFAKGGQQAATTLVIACPLAVALSWSVNTFGVIGPAMSWMASQPNAMRLLPRVAVGVQIGMTAALATACYLPVAGFAGWRQTMSLAAGLAVSTALTTRGSLTKAIKRPFLARLGSRGDTIVPPLTAVSYTMRFALIAGQLGVLTLNQSTRPLAQAILLILLGGWSALRTLWLFREWDNPARKSFVVAAVASA